MKSTSVSFLHSQPVMRTWRWICKQRLSPQRRWILLTERDVCKQQATNTAYYVRQAQAQRGATCIHFFILWLLLCCLMRNSSAACCVVASGELHCGGCPTTTISISLPSRGITSIAPGESMRTN